MRHIKTGTRRGSFDTLTETRDVQAAMMTLQPGGASDDRPSNEHPRSEHGCSCCGNPYAPIASSNAQCCPVES
jgi:hypothetical protein